MTLVFQSETHLFVDWSGETGSYLFSSGYSLGWVTDVGETGLERVSGDCGAVLNPSILPCPLTKNNKYMNNTYICNEINIYFLN